MSDLKKIEEKWQNRWKESKIFEAERDKREKFFITVPYPYVSGPYHIGHGRSYTCGDIFARYRRLKGYNVLFPMAFHITGTPVLAVSKAVQMRDPKALDTFRKYISYHTKDEKEIEKILNSFIKPINVYTYFSKTMKKDFNNLGMSLDWTREFTTADKIYNKFIEWQYLKFKEKKYLIKGDYPITFCLNCGNAVGEDDIKDGDTDPVSVNEFTIIKFKLNDDNEQLYLVAASLRPETIFGQTNLWVNPNIEYVKIHVDDETWVISEECAEKISFQREGVKIIGKIKGSELIGKKCFAPGVNKEIMVLPSFFCDPDVGTGVVTSVPSDAPYDWIGLHDLQKDRELCKKYGLDYSKIIKIRPIPIIETKEWGDNGAEKIIKQMNIKNQNEKEKLDEATQIIYRAGFHTGIMNKNCKKYAGMPVSKAKELVKNELIKNKMADIFFDTSRKAKCRCGGKVIVARLKDQWFLDYNAKGWKETANECLNNMTIYPEKYRQNFKSVFKWLDKRPCARRRGLGTKLPFDKNWIIESLSDSTIYMAFYTIAHIIRNNKIKPEQLIPELFDFVFLNKGNIKDISKKSKIQSKIIEKMKSEFEYWYPVDQRHTAIMHISNHLSFFIFHHVAIFPKKYWPKTITLIEPVIVEGVKMGKSKGNVIPLAKINENYGADVFRLYMAHQAEFGAKIDWRESEVYATKKRLEQFYSLVLSRNSNLPEKNKNLSLHGAALLSKFMRNIEDATNHIDNFNLRKYAQTIFFDVMNDISAYIKSSTKDEQNKILPGIFKKWLIALSPIIPHTCEELWEKMGDWRGKEKFVSMAKWPEPDKKLIRPDTEKKEDYLSNLIEDIKQVMKLANRELQKKTKPSIYLYTAEKWKWDVLDIMKTNNGNAGETIKTCIERFGEIDKKQLSEFIILASKKRLWDQETIKINEEKTLKEQKRYLEKEIGAEIFINEETGFEKKKTPLPYKPAIYIK